MRRIILKNEKGAFLKIIDDVLRRANFLFAC